MPKDKASTPTAAWSRQIIAYVAGHPDRPLKARALARQLDVPTTDYTRFRAVVRELLESGRLVLGAGRTLRVHDQAGLIVGTFRSNPRGFGFVERPGQPSLYVPRPRTAGALDGDKVAVRLQRQRGWAPGPRAEVVRIVERAPRRWVGILEQAGKEWIVRPQGRDRLPPIPVQRPADRAVRPGDLVVVEADETALGPGAQPGTIIERLGNPNDARAQIRGIVQRFALPDGFPPAVQRAASRAAARFDTQNIRDRRDLRSLLAVTIDPPDARDFDDAISIETLPGTKVRLGVHIADVSHFVPPDGPVDREARRRGTSVYFPGRVVPMLPEVLSNDLCCLRPGEPRLAKSVLITYDRHAGIVETDFCASMIRSAARLTYEEVSAALAGAETTIAPDVLAMLRMAEDLARRIRDRRLKHGMIALTLPEVLIRVDEKGRVTDAGPADSSFSHTIIEMFMVEANEAVSRHLHELGLEHLRRIHPAPEEGEAENLAQLAPVLGHKPPTSLDRDCIRTLLDAVRGKPEETAVSFALLRSLPQATYSPSRTGHFALASDDYCHFTSPIRRYPDLTVHRLLSRTLADHPAAEVGEVTPDTELAELGEAMSSLERRAQQAERDAKAALLLILMKRHLGEVFDGIVTSVNSFGVFVQIRPVLAAGLIRVGDFGPDEWHFDRRTSSFTGRRTQRLIFVGQRVRVLVAAVDQAVQEVTLVPAEGGMLGLARGPAKRPTRLRGRGGGRRR